MLKRRFTHHKTAFCFGDFNNQNHKRQKTDDFRIFADRFCGRLDKKNKQPDVKIGNNNQTYSTKWKTEETIVLGKDRREETETSNKMKDFAEKAATEENFVREEKDILSSTTEKKHRLDKQDKANAREYKENLTIKKIKGILSLSKERDKEEIEAAIRDNSTEENTLLTKERTILAEKEREITQNLRATISVRLKERDNTTPKRPT